ncbi:MAG: ABC transporter ATP-binding protein [Microthrixaceae bacterium]
MSGVTFDEVTKRFGDTTAVDRMTLEIHDGEFMVLLGPSGCGKSTALRMIAGLEEVSDGMLSIGSRVVNNIPPRERDIAMVFQSYALYPHMTVRRNIESPLVANRATRLPVDQRNERIDEAAGILGLTEYLERKPGELSGGQRQRVALARAIVRRPEVFLMDEPLSNLDAKLRTQTRLELVELHRRLNTTFVYVTHDQVEAMTMADRIAIIDDGHVQQVGHPQDVYDHPANLFVARFIGSPPMNTIAGTVSTGAGGASIATEAGIVALAELHGAHAGDDVVLGVRPEFLSPADPNTGGDAPGGLRATVENTEMLGHERHLLTRVGSEVMVARLDPSVPTPDIGSEVVLRADPAAVHVFDAATTERLGADPATTVHRGADPVTAVHRGGDGGGDGPSDGAGTSGPGGAQR